MNVSLVSAFSVKTSWETIESDSDYTVQWKTGEITMETTSDKPSIVLLNLEPDTEYLVNVSVDGTVLSASEFKTFPESEPHLENLYESIKTDDGNYDATNFEKKAHDVFLKYFNDVVKSGDTIYTSVNIKGTQRNVETTAVVSDTIMPVSGEKNLFLPFTKDSGKNQKVTLQNAVGKSESESEVSYATKVDLVYNDADDSFIMGDRVFKIGDKFELFGRAVTVADGSIVLVFEDTVELTYPFDITTATNVVGTLGSQFAKNITCNVINTIGTTIGGTAGTCHSSAWMYESDNVTISEATRIVHTMDATGESATVSIGVRATDLSGNTFIEPVLQCAHDSTTISAQDASDATASATFNAAGLQFDTDAGAIYFGSSQTFRIIFLPGSPTNILAIQSYDSGAGDYVTRSEFSDAS